MSTIPLKAEARKDNDVAKNIRAEDRVPCVLYGNEQENTNITCDYSELYRVYSKAGESVIVDLDIDGKKVPALFNEVQFTPVTDRILHVDFYAVNMKKEIEANVPVEFTGESEAVKGLGAVFVTVSDTLTVKCLPTDLPQHLEVSIEGLNEFGDSVLVSDITVPSGVVIVEEPDTMLATVQEPRKEEEPEPTEGEEGAAGAEGAEAAEGGEKKEGEEGGGEGGEEKSE